MTAHPTPLLLALRAIHPMTTSIFVRRHPALWIRTGFDSLLGALSFGSNFVATFTQLIGLIEPHFDIEALRWLMRIKAATETEDVATGACDC
jgi:hypothetical protein